jgi:hypothetical protein
MHTKKLTMRSLLAGLIITASLFMSTHGYAATEKSGAISPEEFRNRMVDWALASELANPSGENLAFKISVLTNEQITDWIATIDDPAAFLGSTERVTTLLAERGADKYLASDLESDAGARSAPLSTTTLTTLFPPDYPPGSGAYKDTIIDAAEGFGIAGASSTNRCDASDWGDYVGVWWPLNKGIDTLDGACVVTGCDITGISCFIACGILETAKIALKIAAVPLEACDIHQGAIDGAEIEATYENTKGLVGDVSHLHDDLTTHDAHINADLEAHDANIDADLVAHDTDIKALLATLQGAVDENQRLIKITMSRQQEIMRLLITPNGRRVINEDVLTCTGDDCPVFPGLQLCPNGSLMWNCDE